jgi:hypothetical protein
MEAWSMPRVERYVPIVLGIAMALAAALLLWEGRDLTFFVDEWNFGYGERSGLAPGELLAPENGHLALVPILITKASLALFGAGTALPLRLVSVGFHLATALLVFLILRRQVGDLVALAPTVLVLFLGAAGDLLVGSHGMPMLIAVASGLGAWLALARRSAGGDFVAALLLAFGLAANGLALVFAAGALALLLGAGSRGRARGWCVLAPLALYALWSLIYGDGESGFALANLAGIPSFAFGSLAAELAAATGVFAVPSAHAQSFDPAAGTALAAALLVGLAGLYLARVRMPLRPLLLALAALLALWLLTGAVASPARQPESARYLYPGVILLALIAGAALAQGPWRCRGCLLLVAVCALGLLPNLREINYAGDFFREQSAQDRAVLAAADSLGPEVDPGLVLEQVGDPAGVGVAEMSFDLGAYRRARDAYGTPAFSAAELRAASPSVYAAAARLLARATGG